MGAAPPRFRMDPELRKLGFHPYHALGSSGVVGLSIPDGELEEMLGGVMGVLDNSVSAAGGGLAGVEVEVDADGECEHEAREGGRQEQRVPSCRRACFLLLLLIRHGRRHNWKTRHQCIYCSEDAASRHFAPR